MPKGKTKKRTSSHGRKPTATRKRPTPEHRAATLSLTCAGLFHLSIDEYGQQCLELGRRVRHVVVGLRCQYGRCSVARAGVGRTVFDLGVPLQHTVRVAHVADVVHILRLRFDRHRDFTFIGLVWYTQQQWSKGNESGNCTEGYDTAA